MLMKLLFWVNTCDFKVNFAEPAPDQFQPMTTDPENNTASIQNTKQHMLSL